MHRRTWQKWSFLMLFATKTHRNYLHRWPSPSPSAEPSGVVVVQLLQNVLEKCFLATAATGWFCVSCVFRRCIMTIIYYVFFEPKMTPSKTPEGWCSRIDHIPRLWQATIRAEFQQSHEPQNHIFIVYTNQYDSKCTKTKINRDINDISWA
jgi:hypothetical protein